MNNNLKQKSILLMMALLITLLSGCGKKMDTSTHAQFPEMEIEIKWWVEKQKAGRCKEKNHLPKTFILEQYDDSKINVIIIIENPNRNTYTIRQKTNGKTERITTNALQEKYRFEIPDVPKGKKILWEIWIEQKNCRPIWLGDVKIIRR